MRDFGVSVTVHVAADSSLVGQSQFESRLRSTLSGLLDRTQANLRDIRAVRPSQPATPASEQAVPEVFYEEDVLVRRVADLREALLQVDAGAGGVRPTKISVRGSLSAINTARASGHLRDLPRPDLAQAKAEFEQALQSVSDLAAQSIAMIEDADKRQSLHQELKREMARAREAGDGRRFVSLASGLRRYDDQPLLEPSALAAEYETQPWVPLRGKAATGWTPQPGIGTSYCYNNISGSPNPQLVQAAECRYVNFDVEWSQRELTFLRALNTIAAYEHETQWKYPGNPYHGSIVEGLTDWATDLPSPYLDTQASQSPDEQDITIGTVNVNALIAGHVYWGYVEVGSYDDIYGVWAVPTSGSKQGLARASANRWASTPLEQLLCSSHFNDPKWCTFTISIMILDAFAMPTTSYWQTLGDKVGVRRGTTFMLKYNDVTSPGVTSANFGVQGGYPLAADFSGLLDGARDTLGVYYFNGTFEATFAAPTSGQLPVNISGAFGVGGDRPVVGDWDCNGTETLGLYRPSTGIWYLTNSQYPPLVVHQSFAFGANTAGVDEPIAGDWNADGCDTIGVHRISTGQWYLSNQTSGARSADISFVYGNAYDVALAGDWDDDKLDSVGVYRPSTSWFYLRDDLNPSFVRAMSFGDPNDTPVTGAWSGLACCA